MFPSPHHPRSSVHRSSRFARSLRAQANQDKLRKKRRIHQVRWGLELGAWLPVAVIVFLTVGAVAAFALVRTGQSQWLAQAPYGSPTTAPTNVPVIVLTSVPVTVLTSVPNSASPTPLSVDPGTGGGGGSTGGGGTTTTGGGTTGGATTTGGGTTAGVTTAPVSSPKPTFSFLNLPVEKSAVSLTGKANGAQCETNKECNSKLCVPNEYGNYCGTKPSECRSGTLRCGTTTQAVTAEKCNVNGYWQVDKLCSGGCSSGVCTTTLCAAGQAMCDGNTRKICSGNGMQWRSESCPAGTACKQGECVADSVPLCVLGTSCSTAGSYCTTAEQQKYVCVDNSWKLLFNGQKVGIVGCERQKAGLYLAGLHDASELISSSAYLLIDCSATSASIFNLSVSNVANACQLDPASKPDFVRINCRSEAPANSIAHSARHEAAKVWAAQHGYTGGIVPSYSEAIGCRREKTWLGFQYIFHREQPVSTIGRRDCAEAFAEAAAMYLEQPCRMKEVFPLQYGWMISSLDSPFKGAPQCAEN